MVSCLDEVLTVGLAVLAKTPLAVVAIAGLGPRNQGSWAVLGASSPWSMLLAMSLGLTSIPRPCAHFEDALSKAFSRSP